jgi:hypothetical protein
MIKFLAFDHFYSIYSKAHVIAEKLNFFYI